MLSFFLKIMKQKCGSYVCVQLLQTLNILFENIRNETSLCKLFEHMLEEARLLVHNCCRNIKFTLFFCIYVILLITSDLKHSMNITYFYKSYLVFL
jgi:protein CLEC16A